VATQTFSEIPDTLHIGRATGHTVFDELQKDLIKAAWFIMGFARRTRQTGPSIRTGPANPVLAAGRSWPIEQGCVSCNKLWACLQSGWRVIGSFGMPAAAAAKYHG
jgi:hypothetical protein